MKLSFVTCIILLAIFTSCGKRSSDYKALQAQNDSLQNVKLKLQEEVDGYFSAMNQIEQNIEKIKSTENTVSIQPVGKELNEDIRVKINELATERRTMIFYESPFRLVKTLTQLSEVFGIERKASVSREISKLFEETIRGTLQELMMHFTEHNPKGEIVLIVAGLEE